MEHGACLHIGHNGRVGEPFAADVREPWRVRHGCIAERSELHKFAVTPQRRAVEPRSTQHYPRNQARS